MSKIQILPPHIVNRIAAGEVVERPASVVKELVENALDAGATRIDVNASAGGRNIRVADDGCGMTPEDAQLAFYNHATSKIQDETDLDHIETLGFRGEALASIAAISRLTCQTRTAEADSGSEVHMDAEGNPTVMPVGCAPGTILEIQDLFYNTPARLKFLKKPGTELSHIEETVQHLALSHPDVKFTLTLQEKPVLKTTGTGDFKITLDEVFRLKEDIEHFIPVRQTDPEAGYGVTGLASTPDVLKSSRKWMITFINGRSVKCHTLNKAVESAYESLVPHGRYPFSVLFLELPLDEVDVNVHPTKKEVRYASANTIFSFVKSAVKNSLEAHGHRVVHLPDAPLDVPVRTFDGPSGLGLNRSGGLNIGGGGASRMGSVTRPVPRSGDTQTAMSFYEPASAEETEQASLAFAQEGQHSLKVIGQLFNTYILIESPQGLMVVDQHIASERSFFEALMQNTMIDEPESQALVTAVPIAMSPTQMDLLRQEQSAFEKMGFGYEVADGQATLTRVPLMYLDKQQPERLFEELVNQLEETGEMKLDLDLMIATMACHSAVRAGDVLRHDVMESIIEQWLACKLPWTCPHGRPIAHTIKTDDLNKFFHRPSLPVNAL